MQRCTADPDDHAHSYAATHGRGHFCNVRGSAPSLAAAPLTGGGRGVLPKQARPRARGYLSGLGERFPPALGLDVQED